VKGTYADGFIQNIIIRDIRFSLAGVRAGIIIIIVHIIFVELFLLFLLRKLFLAHNAAVITFGVERETREGAGYTIDPSGGMCKADSESTDGRRISVSRPGT
jgi:hypothetical protein